jgi:hypothetical protein
VRNSAKKLKSFKTSNGNVVNKNSINKSTLKNDTAETTNRLHQKKKKQRISRIGDKSQVNITFRQQ